MRKYTLPVRICLVSLLLLITWQWSERRASSQTTSQAATGLPRLVVRLGHAAAVKHVAFSSDGRFAVTAGEDKAVILWSVATGRQIRRFEKEIEAESLEFAPNGTTLLIDQELWSAETGTEICAVGSNAKFAPDGRFLLTTGGADLELRSALTGTEIRRFKKPKGFKSFSFSPDSRFILITQADKSAALVNVETGQDVGHFTGDEARFSPNGAFVITHREGTVLWNVASGKEERHFNGEAAHVSSNGRLIITAESKESVLREISSGAEVRRFAGGLPEFSPDDRLVVTRDQRGPAIFELATGRELYHFETQIDSVDGLIFSFDGRFFLTRDDGNHKGNEVTVWDAVKMRPTREFPTFNTTSAVFSPDGSYVLTGDEDRVARLWDSATGLEVRRFEGDTTFFSSLKFVNQGQFLETNTTRVSTEKDTESASIKLLSSAASQWETATGQQRRFYQALRDTVYSAAAFPDGRFVVTGGEQAAHLWEVASGRETRTFEGHTAPIVSVVVSLDGRTILTGSKDGTARLWETASGRELQRFNGHSDELIGAMMSKNGRLVLTGSARLAKLWDARTGQELQQFGGRKPGVIALTTCIALSPDGSFALTGNFETPDLKSIDEKSDFIYSVSLWDTATGKERWRIKYPDAVRSVAFSPDGSLVLTGCVDANVSLLKQADGSLVRKFQHDLSTGLSVAFSPDGQLILTGGLDKGLPGHQSLGFQACLWNAATGQLVKTFVDQKTSNVTPFLFTWAADFSADGHSIVTVVFKTNDFDPISLAGRNRKALAGFAQLWNTDTGKELGRFGRDAEDPQSIKFSPDGRTLLVHTVEQNSLQIVDAETGRELRPLVLPPDSIVTDMAYSPDGRLILAGATGGAYLWDAQTGKLLNRFSAFSLKEKEWDSAITSVRFSSDNQVVSIVVGGRIFFCDIQTGGFLKMIPGPERELPPTEVPLDMAFAADGEFMALVKGEHLQLLNLLTGKQPLEFKGHTKKITLVAFSADKKFMASAGNDETVRLWDTATAKQLHAFQQTGPVTIVVFAPDGRSLLSAGDQSVRLWDTTTGKMLREAQPDEAITSAALSIDGRLIATGAKSGNIYLRNAVTGAALRTLKGHTEKVTTLAFTPDSRFLVSRGDDKTVRLWDLTRGAEVPRFTGQKKNVTSMALSANGRWIVTAGEDKVVRLLDLNSGKEIRRVTNRQEIVNSVAFSPDGGKILTANMELRVSERLLSGSNDVGDFGGSARLWNLSTKELESSFGEEETIHVDFSPDGKYMLTATGSSWYELLNTPNMLPQFFGFEKVEKVDIRETKKGAVLHHFDFEDREAASSVAMSPDGRLLLTGTIYDANENEDNLARLLSTDDKGEEVEKATFMGHSGMVGSVAFSPDGRFVVTGSLDGTMGIWNPATGEQICRLISFRDGTWVVVDKDGRFDTNNLEEIKGLQWVMPDDPLTALPLEIFMRPYYEPRLLPRLLAKDVFSNVSALADLNRVQPKVTIPDVKQDGPDTASVAVEVESLERAYQRGKTSVVESGAKDLRLFRDGQLVGYRDGNLLGQRTNANNGCEPIAGSTKKCRALFEHLSLPRQASINDVVFSAYAFNTSDVKSETSRYRFPYTTELPARKGRVYLITVGVSRYENPDWNLEFAANDAHLVHDTVAAKMRATGAYDDVVDVMLTAEERVINGRKVIEKTATKDNFKKILKLLAGEKLTAAETREIPNAQKIEKASTEDLVLIFYSSHGYRDSQRFYLFPYDTGSGAGRDPEAVVPHAISSDDLYLWLRDVDAGNLVLVIDACHAAGVTGREFKPGPMGSRGMGQLAYDKGMTILAATQSDTTAAEVDNIAGLGKIQHGLLTYALVEDGLIEEQADSNRDKLTTLREWLAYGVDDVPKLFAEALQSQIATNRAARVGTPRRSAKGVRFISKGEGESATQQPSLFDFTEKVRRKRQLPVEKRVTDGSSQPRRAPGRK